MTEIRVILFKQSGKYYTEENWEIPEDAIGPFDMINSPSFRRIGGGPVLITEDEPWGYPHLFPAEIELTVKANRSGIPTNYGTTQNFEQDQFNNLLGEINYGNPRMSEKEYKELVEKMKAPGYKPFQVLPPEPVSEQEKFFKALNEGKVFLKPFGNETTINIKP